MVESRNNMRSSRRKVLSIFLFVTVFCYDGVTRAYVFPRRPSRSRSSFHPPARTASSTRLNFAKDSRLSDLSEFGASNYDELEQEVYASARAQMDVQKVKSTIIEQAAPSSDNDPQRTAIMAAQWKISLAAASFVSTFVTIATHSNLPITAIVFVSVFVVANQDPLEEEGAAGSLARLLGRLTIQSVETTKPKLKAMARAAITSEDESREQEMNLLQQRIEVLENENIQLTKWKEQRNAADALLSQYALDDLKAMARANHLPVGGTKIQLVMRLLENRVLIPM